MIFIVVNNSWYAYNFRLNLARSLKKEGYEVCFVAPYDKKYSELLKEEFKFYDIYVDSKGINPLLDLKTIYLFYKLFITHKPEIVLNFTIKPNIYSSIIARLLGIKAISNITGLGTVFIKQTIVTKIVKLLYKFALKNNYVTFFQNKDDKKLFLQNKLVLNKNIDVLPGSGVDLKKFKPIKKSKENKKFKFLLIARLLRDKGIIEYIDAIKVIKSKYKNVEFHLLGAVGVSNNTAITHEELDFWVKNDLVVYLGMTDNVQEVISQADCVVLPSYREGVPRSLLEASAMEKPIIATNVVGCKEVVKHGVNGFLCEVKNPYDLAKYMEIMINTSSERRLEMGKAGRVKMLNEFDEEIVISKYLQYINEALK